MTKFCIPNICRDFKSQIPFPYASTPDYPNQIDIDKKDTVSSFVESLFSIGFLSSIINYSFL
jgi:hypothetical protein